MNFVIKCLFISFFTTCVILQSSFSKDVLRVGDFVLLPLNCYACRVISDETGSIYSHMGIILEINDHDIILGESLGKVKLTTLSQFFRQKIPEQSMGFYRSRELLALYQKSTVLYKQFEIELFNNFNNAYKGLPYDDQFLWGNSSLGGEEKLYCSEFVTKLINPFLKNKIQTHKMNYLKNWDFWVQYFRRNPPQNKQGNNPSFFTNPKKFIQIFPKF